MRPSLFYPVGCLFRLGWTTLIIIAFLALLKHFVFDILPISGASMVPNFQNKDIVVFNKISYVTANPRRGDNAVLRFPGDPIRERYIKRIIGLPGEKVSIQGGKVYINDELLKETYLPNDLPTTPDITIQLNQNEYYLIGDNRPISSDSRIWGPASREDFIGKAFFILLPLRRFHAVPAPIYDF